MARIDRLFEDLLAKRGSDLHLSIGHPPLARASGAGGGELIPLRDAPIERTEMDALLFEITSPLQKARIEAELDLEFAYAPEEGGASAPRFRANYFYKATGLAAVFHALASKVVPLADLHAPELVARLADRRSGLILVTGRAGSGKTTTIAAMLDRINQTRAAHIVTLEDPVERVHEPKRSQITHREIGVHAPSFAAALRSAGREDADVLFVGQLRSAETIKLALSLASRGLLVVAALPTRSAAAAVDRILNAFPADEQAQVRGMLADSLVGILGQQLVPASDGQSRVAAFEVVMGGDAVGALVREGKTSELAATPGTQSMDSALHRLVAQGRVDFAVALEASTDKDTFAKHAAP